MRNCKLCTIAAILLAILLGVQVVNSNSYLKKLFTWKNAVVQTNTLIDTGSKKVVELQQESGKIINEVTDKSKQWLDDKKYAQCKEIKDELNTCQTKLAECKSAPVCEVCKTCPTCPEPAAVPTCPTCPTCPATNCPDGDRNKPSKVDNEALSVFLSPMVETLPSKVRKNLSSTTTDPVDLAFRL